MRYICLLLALFAPFLPVSPVRAEERPAAEVSGRRLPEARPRPFDQPDLAESFYAAKRRPTEPGRDLALAYAAARRHTASMPRYSSVSRRLAARSAPGGESGASATLATWSYLGPGNIGGRTRAMVIDRQRPATMYLAGVSGGIWKTTNAGRRWRAIADDLVNIAVNALAIDPNDPKVLYAGTGEGYFREVVRGTGLPLRGGGIFKTTDAGATWTRLPATGGRSFHWVNDLVVSHGDGSRIYAATRRGVFRSLDAGLTWDRILAPRVRGGCLDLVARTDTSSDELLASCGTFRQATVYRATAAEGADAWERVLSDPGMGRTSLAVSPSEQDVVYALAASNVPGPGGRFEQALHAVFRSDRGGSAGSWEAVLRNTDPRKINTLLLHNGVNAALTDCGFDDEDVYLAMGWYVNTIAVDPVDPDRVWVGGVDLFRSDDGGRNWSPASYWWSAASRPDFVHADQHALVFHPRKPKVLFALNDGGIYRTRDARAPLNRSDLAICNPGSSGMRWQPLNRSYGVTQFYHGTPYPDGRSYLGGTQDNGTVRGSDASGANRWARILGGDGGYSAIDPNDPDVIYASFQSAAIRKSTDGGVTFRPAENGLVGTGADLNDFRAVGPDFLFIAPMVMDPNDSGRLWLGGRRLWRTDNGAAGWTAASERLPGGGKVSAIAVAPALSAVVLAGTDKGGIFRTAEALAAGEETAWSAARPRAGWVSWLAFDPGDTDVVYATYAGFGGKHVWRSTDGGATWRAIDGTGAARLPDVPVHSIVVDPDDPKRLYLGTDLGVFVSLDAGLSWSVENTGFATAVTESLALTSDRGRTWLFAFTHGRGAWKVRLD